AKSRPGPTVANHNDQGRVKVSEIYVASYTVNSPFSFVVAIALTFFEFMVQCLQAYIFTLLTALYITGALADEH
ncbi:MAG: F0F1 ATP synthase subunit A, partial [Actinomycetota bacterium]